MERNRPPPDPILGLKKSLAFDLMISDAVLRQESSVPHGMVEHERVVRDGIRQICESQGISIAEVRLMGFMALAKIREVSLLDAPRPADQ